MTLKLVATTEANGDMKELVLEKDRYCLGRSRDNDWCIRESHISGHHAEIVRDAQGAYAIRDLGSANGTFLNQNRLDGSHAIKPGDAIRLGDFRMVVVEWSGEPQDADEAVEPETVGRLQAELHREKAERNELGRALEEARGEANRLLVELEASKRDLESKDREMREQRRESTRSDSEAVGKLKEELAELRAGQDAAREDVAKALREKQTLGSSYERLRTQLETAEESLRESERRRVEAETGSETLARRLKEGEASNAELAGRVRQQEAEATDMRELIGRLELQIRQNESEAVEREQKRARGLEAELKSANRRIEETEKARQGLEGQLGEAHEAKQRDDARILALESRVAAQDAEIRSLRDLVAEAEKKRVDLVSKMTKDAALLVGQIRMVEALRREISDATLRFEAAESELLARHADERDRLLGQLSSERLRCERLETLLGRTREGMSAALRNAREENVRTRSQLLADGTRRAAGLEEELSRVIRSAEEGNRERERLEDELNRCEEEIERLRVEVDGLGVALRDETKARSDLADTLDRTRAGFSHQLRSGWQRQAEYLAHAEEETGRCIETEGILAETLREKETLSGDLEKARQEHESEIRDWSGRCEALQKEKQALIGDRAGLEALRAEIQQAVDERRRLVDELSNLAEELRQQERIGEGLGAKQASLKSENERTKGEVASGKKELETLKERCAAAAERAQKDEETAAALETRIESLRKLESEIEAVVTRKRRKHRIGRGEVFSELEDAPGEGGVRFSPEDFYRKLVLPLDQLDDLAKRYEGRWYCRNLAGRLDTLRREFGELLREHSVVRVDLEPGAPVALTERKRINLIPVKNGNGKGTAKGTVVKTLRPGYVLQNGKGEVVLRKAEVAVD